jgi:ABC-type nickel/cobalt efflux system permease component RcnA
VNPIDLAQQAGAHPWLFLVAALFLGIFHGIEPGHSKGMMTAFIIGTRGTYLQAILLALSVTVSHTAIVWILAWPASYGGMIWSGEEVTPYLNLISGIVILLLSYWMLRQFNRLNRPHDHGHDHHHHHHEHFHEHEHEHEHEHGLDHGHEHSHEHSQEHSHDHPHEHGHGHSHEDAHAHAHAVSKEELDVAALDLGDDAHARHHARELAEHFANRKVTTGQVVLFGLGSGLAPCTAAIVILITCFHLKEPWLGMGLVAAFSAGLGLTLTSVALLASWGVKAIGHRYQGFEAFIRKAPFLSALVTAAIGIYLLIQFFRSYQ